MQKIYGKLTADQFKAFVKYLPKLRAMAKELAELLRDTPNEKLQKFYKTAPVWADLYELSFLQLVVSGINSMGLAPRMEQAIASDNTYQFLQADLENDFCDVPEPVVSLDVLLRHVMPIWYSLQSISYYGCSLSGLVALVRDHGDTDAVFKAVSIDPTVMNCPTIAAVIAKAQLARDADFREKLATALKGPSKKIMASLQDMRFSFFVLRELGINDLSEEDLRDLMVGGLGVYADTPSSGKNLSEAYRKSKNQKTI